MKRPRICRQSLRPPTVEVSLPLLPPPDAQALLETIEQIHAVLYRVYGRDIEEHRCARKREQARLDLLACDDDLPF